MSLRRCTALGLVAVALVAACGGNGSHTTIEASAREWQLSPGSWTVAAGSTVEVDFTNLGNMAHEWTLLAETVNSEAEFDPASVLFTTGTIKPGASYRGTFTVPAAGTYTVGCFIPSHFDQGMRAILRVTE